MEGAVEVIMIVKISVILQMTLHWYYGGGAELGRKIMDVKICVTCSRADPPETGCETGWSQSCHIESLPCDKA